MQKEEECRESDALFMIPIKANGASENGGNSHLAIWKVNNSVLHTNCENEEFHHEIVTKV